jgi:hypothetical protein
MLKSKHPTNVDLNVTQTEYELFFVCVEIWTWICTMNDGSLVNSATPLLSKNYNTVMIRIQDCQVFKWSFSGHFLGPVFEQSSIWMFGSTKFVQFLNGASLDCL